MTRRHRRLGVAALVIVLSLVGAAVVIGDEGDFMYGTPSEEDIIEAARERGITGPVNVPTPAVPDPEARPDAYGPYLMVPRGWDGPLPDLTVIADIPDVPGASSIADTQKSDLWITPLHLPPGYRLVGAVSGNLEAEIQQQYENQDLGSTFLIYVFRQQVTPVILDTWNTNGNPPNTYEKTQLHGQPTIIRRFVTPDGELRVSVDTFDETSGIRYVVHGLDAKLTTASALEILEGLLP